MSEPLLELIEKEFDKKIAEKPLILAVPCVVLKDLGDEYYRVYCMSDESEYEFINLTGSHLEVGDRVQVYYKTNNMKTANGYIGASISNKPCKSGYVYSDETDQMYLDVLKDVEEKTIVKMTFKTLCPTDIFIGTLGNLHADDLPSSELLNVGAFLYFYLDGKKLEMSEFEQRVSKFDSKWISASFPITVDYNPNNLTHTLELRGSASHISHIQQKNVYLRHVKLFVYGEGIRQI